MIKLFIYNSTFIKKLFSKKLFFFQKKMTTDSSDSDTTKIDENSASSGSEIIEILHTPHVLSDSEMTVTRAESLEALVAEPLPELPIEKETFTHAFTEFSKL